MIEMGMTFDLAQLIIDSEIYKMVLHTLNGFEVNEETLALDVIKEVKMGEFVSQKHTTRPTISRKSSPILTLLTVSRENSGWPAAARI